MYTLILVEDDYQIRTGLGTYFPWKETGFEFICSFENGRQALDYLTVNDVDLVLTDIKMPVMDGIELAAQLKERKPQILVVFLSAYRDFGYAQQALEYGVKNYIVKSTKFDELVTIFKNIWRLLDENGREFNRVEPEERPLTVDDRVLRKVLDYIGADLAGATLQSLAERVNMSPVYLSRYFKEKAGINFVDYLVREKMEKAAQLLCGSEYSMTRISEIVGYSNEKNFSRAFKKYHGITPFDYRRII